MAAASLLACAPAWSTVTTYAGESSFLAAVRQPGAYSETFDGASGKADSYTYGIRWSA